MQITKPRTQRKKLFQAPAHRRHRYFSASLSPELKQKHGTNAFPLKMGDTVRVMRGDRRGIEGKVIRVDRQKFRIFIEGVAREKVDGTTIQIPVHPSKVMITNLDLDDKVRREILKRKGIRLEKEVLPPPIDEITEKKKEKVKNGLKTKKTAKKSRKKGTKKGSRKSASNAKRTSKGSRKKEAKKAKIKKETD